MSNNIQLKNKASKTMLKVITSSSYERNYSRLYLQGFVFQNKGFYLCSRHRQVVFQSEGQLNFTTKAPNLHRFKQCCRGHWLCELGVRLANYFRIPAW